MQFSDKNASESIRNFESWLESAIAEINALEMTPADAVDEGLFEDVASVVNHAAELATNFGYPEAIPIRQMLRPIEGKRIVGRLVSWVRANAVYADPSGPIEELMGKAEVAKVLRVSQKTIDNERQRGKLPFVKIGMQVRFRRSDVRNYIEAGMVK
jgi:excisionase family DNA binding protein